MREFAKGVHDVQRGLAFLRAHRQLWKWVVAPAVVTAAVAIALVVAVGSATSHVVASVVGSLPHWAASLLGAGLTLVVTIALATGAVILFVTLVGLLAGPFCELLSEAAEAELTGTPGPAFSLGSFLRDLIVGVSHSLRRLVAAAFGTSSLFALSMIPVIGSLAAIAIGAWLSCTSTAYDCYDAVLARRGLAYRDKLRFLGAHRARSLGLGVTITALMLVPGVNLVALGIGAVGATLAAHDLEAANRRGP
jgi:CysZ protein